MIPAQRKPLRGDQIREATISALKHVVDPLLELMFDAGVTVHEFNRLLRDTAVHAATKRVIKECGRNSKSRVAIVTGLPRSEVTKILHSRVSVVKTQYRQHPARRVLAAWFENPQYLTATGEPAVLPIFGKRRSFERLVSMHGAGIPVRAMLDELTQIDAVERLGDQQIRAKSRVPISTGLTRNAIAALGERCGDLLQTLTNNIRRTLPPFFEATAMVSDADPEILAVVRREIAEQGASFINAASSLLKRSQRKPHRTLSTSPAKHRVGVTVYYFEEQGENPATPGRADKLKRRKNLRRIPRPMKRQTKQRPIKRIRQNIS